MKLRFTVEGLDCANCAAHLETMIAGKEGIASCKVNFITERITVETELPEAEAEALVQKTAKEFSRSLKISH